MAAGVLALKYLEGGQRGGGSVSRWFAPSVRGAPHAESWRGIGIQWRDLEVWGRSAKLQRCPGSVGSEYAVRVVAVRGCHLEHPSAANLPPTTPTSESFVTV